LGALGLVGLVGGCSDPVPPAAQGAISLHLATPASGLICSPGPHWANVPDDPLKPPQTSGDSGGKRAVDGEGGMSVACTVRQEGDTYTVTAALKSPAHDLMGRSVDVTSINLSVKIKEDQEDAIGRVLLFDDRTQVSYGSSDCTFSVKPTGGASQLAIHPGRAWGQITCRNLTDPSNVSTPSCDVDRAFFVIENCQQ